MKLVALTLAGFLISCSRNTTEEQQKSALSFFESSIGAATPSVRIFDFREARVNPRESSRWIAFDVSSKEWEEYRKSNNLAESKFVGDPLETLNSQTHLETGFEGYLDGDFVRLRGKRQDGIISQYFVRLIKGYTRVVYFEQEY